MSATMTPASMARRIAERPGAATVPHASTNNPSASQTMTSRARRFGITDIQSVIVVIGRA